ncbi:MAG TPA: serine hydrolase domain-containing protein, partial [Candidatus Sulfomarinibacteraceae bacterium]|nr:serine hydrolase domain-containing protein [Candidatus Sulfomarinibacteraceae bacterium]
MILRTACLILIATLSAAPPSAEESGPAIADTPRVADALAAWSVWVEYQAALAGVPAVSVAVVHDQETLLLDAFGLADPDTGREARPDTLYSICSISKLFTAIGVLQQRDAGRLRLDDELGTLLPWFGELEDVHPDDEPITLRRVLTHSAGLPRESDSPYWAGPDFDFPTRDELRLRLAEQQTLYPSGRYFQYSNLGLSLAGEVVAAVAGTTWEAHTRRAILDPLGMDDTFTSAAEARATGRMAVGYSARRGGPQRERLGPFEVEGIAPAAGMVSSAGDLARFASWQLRLLEGGGTEVLRASTLREMQRVHWVDPDWETTWGLGFAVFQLGERTVVGHSGGCPGFYTAFRLVPRDRLGIVVLTNAIGADVGSWAAEGIGILGPAVTGAREADETLEPRDPAFDRYVGTYDTVWGRFAIVR